MPSGHRRVASVGFRGRPLSSEHIPLSWWWAPTGETFHLTGAHEHHNVDHWIITNTFKSLGQNIIKTYWLFVQFIYDDWNQIASEVLYTIEVAPTRGRPIYTGITAYLHAQCFSALITVEIIYWGHLDGSILCMGGNLRGCTWIKVWLGAS